MCNSCDETQTTFRGLIKAAIKMYTGDPVIELSASDIPIIDNKTFSSHQSSGRLLWRQQEI